MPAALLAGAALPYRERQRRPAHGGGASGRPLCDRPPRAMAPTPGYWGLLLELYRCAGCRRISSARRLEYALAVGVTHPTGNRCLCRSAPQQASHEKRDEPRYQSRPRSHLPARRACGWQPIRNSPKCERSRRQREYVNINLSHASHVWTSAAPRRSQTSSTGWRNRQDGAPDPAQRLVGAFLATLRPRSRGPAWPVRRQTH